MRNTIEYTALCVCLILLFSTLKEIVEVDVNNKKLLRNAILKYLFTLYALVGVARVLDRYG